MRHDTLFEGGMQWTCFHAGLTGRWSTGSGRGADLYQLRRTDTGGHAGLFNRFVPLSANVLPGCIELPLHVIQHSVQA
jgi:hypothetical protein